MGFGRGIGGYGNEEYFFRNIIRYNISDFDL